MNRALLTRSDRVSEVSRSPKIKAALPGPRSHIVVPAARAIASAYWRLVSGWSSTMLNVPVRAWSAAATAAPASATCIEET